MSRPLLHGSSPIPAPFARLFNADALSANAATIVMIDASGAILWLNPAWERFAEANRGVQIRERFGVGTCYFEGISGPLRQYFVETFSQVLQTNEPFELDYECSSPEMRVLMRLRVIPVREAGLLLEHSYVSEQPFQDEHMREPSAHYVSNHGLISQCSNCRKVRRTDTLAWDWVPHWVSAPLPNVSHGICDLCYGFYWRARMRA